MTVVRLPASGFRRTPWKNGGGVTVDIADAYRAGAEPGSWAGMVWRFGRTTIDRPGPFSDLAGYDRILTVVAGRGLVLRSGDGAALDMRAPCRPVAFPGELALASELEEGPVEVVNLIGDRAAVAIAVDVLARPGPVRLAAGEVVLYAPAGAAAVALGAEELAIPAGDALRVRAGSALACRHLSGTLLVATVTARSRAA